MSTRFARAVLWLGALAPVLWCGVSADAQPPPQEVVPIVQVTSAECLACHDGTSGPSVTTGESHRYDIEYRLVQPSLRRHLKTADAASGLGSTVADDCLVNGRVECVSCHATHEQETSVRFRLRAGIPQICRGCHNIG